MFIQDLMHLYDKLVCDTTIPSSTSVSCPHATLTVHETTDVGVLSVEAQVTVNIKVRLCFMELTGLKSALIYTRPASPYKMFLL